MNYKPLLNVFAAAALVTAVAAARPQPQGESHNADNTKINQRDRAQSEPTADQAKNNLSDRELMQKIRRSLMEDKSLSSYAHNIKIIAEHGRVTLKGPVRSEEEKRAVEQRAAEVAGAGNVSNEITIKATGGR